MPCHRLIAFATVAVRVQGADLFAQLVTGRDFFLVYTRGAPEPGERDVIFTPRQYRPTECQGTLRL